MNDNESQSTFKRLELWQGWDFISFISFYLFFVAQKKKKKKGTSQMA